MRDFTVADLTVNGELQSKAVYSYGLLEQIPGALDLITHFATSLWRSPEEFELPFPPPQRHLSIRWRCSARTAGIATLRADAQLVSLSLLATGIDADADTITLRAFQQHLLRELRDTSFEPAFALMELTDRPLVATINFFSPPEGPDRVASALCDRCFAAAYFRMLNLA